MIPRRVIENGRDRADVIGERLAVGAHRPTREGVVAIHSDEGAFQQKPTSFQRCRRVRCGGVGKEDLHVLLSRADMSPRETCGAYCDAAAGVWETELNRTVARRLKVMPASRDGVAATSGDGEENALPPNPGAVNASPTVRDKVNFHD